MTLTGSHTTCAIQINYLYTELTPTPTQTHTNTLAHMHSTHIHTHTDTHTCTHVHVHTHPPVPSHTSEHLTTVPLLHKGRCRVCLCKTIHAECHLCKDSCYKRMVQWELQTANVAVKVAMVSCSTLVFGNCMHMFDPLGHWNQVDTDILRHVNVKQLIVMGWPEITSKLVKALPWRLITNWFTDWAWPCIW